MAGFNLGSFASAYVMGQQINADLDERKADVALKKQQLAQNQMAMSMQQQKQQEEQQRKQITADVFNTADKVVNNDRIANGDAPDKQAEDTYTKMSNQFIEVAKREGKLGDYTGAEDAIKKSKELQETADTHKIKNLEIQKKQADDAASFAGSALEKLDSTKDFVGTQKEVYQHVLETQGLKAAQAIPTKPMEFKAFLQDVQKRGQTANEQISTQAQFMRDKENREEKAREHDDNMQIKRVHIQLLAAAREANILARQERMEEKAREKANQPHLSDDALNINAYARMFTGKEMSGMGNATATEKIKVANREAEIAKSLGLSPTEVALLPTDTKAKAKAISGLTIWGAFMEKSQIQLEGTIDLAISTAGKLSRSDIQAVNKAMLSGQTEFGSGPPAAYAQQMQTWRAEYARMLSGPTSNGMLHVDAEKKADELISAASSPEQLRALKESTKQEAAITNRAIRSQIDDLHGSMMNPGGNRASGKPTVSNW